MYRKWFTIIITLFLIHTNLMAQEALAKLRYQEAEEAFNAGDFSLTLKKLDEVVGILKDENPRTLYLRIQAQKAMLPADPCQNEEVAIQLMNSCKLYVSRYEKVEALQDNAIDVYKIMDASGVTPTTAAERTAYEEIKKQWASLDYTSLRKLYEAHTAKYSSCLTRNAAHELNLLKLSEKYNAILTAGERATDNMLLEYLNQEIECKRFFGKTDFTTNYKTIYSMLAKSENNVLQQTTNDTFILILVDNFTFESKKLKIMQQGFNNYPDLSTLDIINNFSTLCPSGWRVPYAAELIGYFNSLTDDLKKKRFFENSVVEPFGDRTRIQSPHYITKASDNFHKIDMLFLVGFDLFPTNTPYDKNFKKNRDYSMIMGPWNSGSFHQVASKKFQINSLSELNSLDWAKDRLKTLDEEYFKIKDKEKRPLCTCIFDGEPNQQ